MTRLKLTAIFFLLLISLGAHAQTMAVESFELAQTDLTANTPGTMVYDQNGNLCALIKLETTQKGFTFNVGVLGVAKTEEHVGEIWIYVPFGIKKITVQHPQLGTLRDYPIPCSIDKGRTYIMKLTSGNVRTIVEHAVTRQFLCVELIPSDAILEVNGTMKVTENGAWQELLPFGKYSYRASRQDYYDAVGEVTVSDPKDPHIISIRLKPAFGHVSVLGDSESNGAVVYIDNRQVGKVPVNDIQLSSGTHTLRIMKELYKVYDETFVIADEERKQIRPHLVPDFAEVTLTTSEGASIYVNGTLKARHTWTGVLSSGSYIFETRQNGHIPFKTNFDITRADHTRTIQIDPPTPIYGTLILSSNPMRAKLYMNGKYIGDAPKQLPNCIIGNYKIEARMDGYKSQSKTVTVSEGQDASLAFTLEKITSQSSTSSSASYDSGASVHGSTTSSQPQVAVYHETTPGAANCYIVSKSGTYSFPTVKGNSTVSVGPVASAAVLWESFGTSVTPSVGDLIKSVSYANGTITFRTADRFKEGNAVIAAKDASGTILWSWHIWLTDKPRSQVYNNKAGTMMDRNLGATSATPGDVGALGLLYQWGRKDPFLGSSSISSSTVAKSTINWPSAVHTNSSYGTVSYVTANPTTFLKASSSPYDWHYSSRDNTLWTTSDKTKSIYDPCPSGWRVPDGGFDGVWAKVGFDNTTYDSKNEGISFIISSPSKTWYPASGYRFYGNGNLSIVGYCGFYWSASPRSYDAYGLSFYDDGNVYPWVYDPRAYGFSVRCVRESK